MGKRVLVLTGSPRENGNSEMLADAFIEGVGEAGHEAVKRRAARLSIKGCTACNACYSKGRPCVFDDDFNALAAVLEQSDGIALVTPLYWYTFSSQIKLAIDKFHYVSCAKREWRIRECGLIVCGADKAARSYEGIQQTFDSIAAYAKWTKKGVVVVPGVLEKGAVAGTDGLDLARAFGKAFFA